MLKKMKWFKTLYGQYQTYSLSTRMSLTISVFSLILLVLIGVSAYRIALEESEEMIDRQMQEMANFLEVHNQKFRSSAFDPLHRYDETDVFIDVIDQSELQPTGLTHGYLLPATTTPYFSRHKTSRGDLQIYVRPSGHRQIQVSQQVHVRVELAKELAINMLMPYLFFVPIGIYGIYRLIRRHLKPINELEQVFSKRDPLDLSDIHIDRMPAEITPAINELNYLFKRMASAQKQQQFFVANAAHELRTPLTAINLQIKLLSKIDQNAAVYQDNLNDLRLSSQRMMRLVDQLMALAKQDEMAGSQLEALSVLDAIRVAMNQLHAASYAKDMQVRVDIQAEAHDLYIMATTEAIESILLNILDNAIKYSPSLSEILIKVYLQGSEVTIEIHDSGPGIQQPDIKNIRQRFVRLEQTQHQVVGSGLGLSIVDAALKLIDGELNFSSSLLLSGLCVQLKFKRCVISSPSA
ncbi:two-component system sensor histidine kinase PmrB [Acinetobacter apis]|nr:ATP-binding protein [Acinetobacter apis]